MWLLDPPRSSGLSPLVQPESAPIHHQQGEGIIAPYIVIFLHKHFENQLNRYRTDHSNARQHFFELKKFVHFNEHSEKIEIKEMTLDSEKIDEMKTKINTIVEFIKEKNLTKSEEKAISIPNLVSQNFSLDDLPLDKIKEVLLELAKKLLEYISHSKTKKNEKKESLLNVTKQLQFDAPNLDSSHLNLVKSDVIKIGTEVKDFTLSAFHFIGKESHQLIDMFRHHSQKDSDDKGKKLKLLPAYPTAVFDAKYKSSLPGKLVFDNAVNPDKRAETLSVAVNSAYQNTSNVLKFWKDVLNINFVQVTTNVRADSVIHFMRSYVNAFFEGKRMVYGDGNQYFRSFYLFLMIAGHEMGHAIVGNKLNYQDQSGALNESYADIFGAATDMYTNKISVKDYHWEVGKDLITYKGQPYPLRKFTPGPAFTNVPPAGGVDIQPDTMPDTTWYEKNKEILVQDGGGVHILSKIPNRVFYIVTQEQNDWKAPLLFWKRVLDKINNPDINFADFAALQIATATAENNLALVTQLQNGWKTVGIIPSRNSLLAEVKEEIIEESLNLD